jgi:hypothetical protein
MSLGSSARAAEPFRAATTAGSAELVKTIPVSRHAGAEPRAVLSLSPRQLPTLESGDRLHSLGEVQVTTTCIEPGPRCIGRRYSFSPHVSGWLVLARGRHGSHGSAVERISAPEHLTCGQRRPNRNHHCVLVFRETTTTVSASELPCSPDRCFLNLVLEAHHSGARSRNRLIIGADRPDGGIQQGQGRVSAVVVPADASPDARKRDTTTRVHDSVRIAEGHGPWSSIYSVKLPHLHKGDVVTADARQVYDIGGLSHAAYDMNQIVLTQGRRKTHPGPVARASASPSPALDEANGFNCTHGPSAYQSPCISRKVGEVRIRREPVDRRGRPVPLYVNLICRGLLKVEQKSWATAQILDDGFPRVTHYRAP